MSLNANKVPNTGNSGSYPTLEAGTYPALLAGVVSLGIQPQQYLKETKPPKFEIMLTWELYDEFGKDEDGNDMLDKPRWVSERMPLNSLGSEKAKSTARYYALDPKEIHDGDFAALVGVPAMVTLSVTKDGKYNNVSAVTAMRSKEADKAPSLAQEPKVFDMDSPDMEVYGSLSQWVKDIITGGLEFDGSKLAVLLGEEPSESKDEDDEGGW